MRADHSDDLLCRPTPALEVHRSTVARPTSAYASPVEIFAPNCSCPDLGLRLYGVAWGGGGTKEDRRAHHRPFVATESGTRSRPANVSITRASV